MINLESIQLQDIAIHHVGNKLHEEGLRISSKDIELPAEETTDHLLQYLLTPFSENEVYNFDHSSELGLNEVFSFSKKIFGDPDCFYLTSIEIAKHLYEQSDHPKINGGDLCVCYFSDCLFDGIRTDAIGIFKSEIKDTFLKFDKDGADLSVRHDSGININKLDKGCMIFNIGKEDGYTVCVVDSNKAGGTLYWKTDFLDVKPAADNYHFTQDFLSMTKNYVTKQIPEEFDVTKTDQIDLLNRSVDYFKNNEQFEKADFEQEVLQDQGLIDSFQMYDTAYRQEYEVELQDSFDISPKAVKKQARVFKSVLKLDKNFHIYIHGNKELIEKGTDQDGRKYYKIYYEDES